MGMLQELYGELQEAHPKAHRRPSGLTVVDSVDSPDTQSKDGSGSWCASRLASAALVHARPRSHLSGFTILKCRRTVMEGHIAFCAGNIS